MSKDVLFQHVTTVTAVFPDTLTIDLRQLLGQQLLEKLQASSVEIGVRYWLTSGLRSLVIPDECLSRLVELEGVTENDLNEYHGRAAFRLGQFMADALAEAWTKSNRTLEELKFGLNWDDDGPDRTFFTFDFTCAVKSDAEAFQQRFQSQVPDHIRIDYQS